MKTIYGYLWFVLGWGWGRSEPLRAESPVWAEPSTIEYEECYGDDEFFPEDCEDDFMEWG